jgi:hypothetical protein
MNLPFTPEQFFEIFKNYNLTIWPFQIILVLLALVIVSLSLKTIKNGDIIINGILAFLWLWIGIVYHLTFFSVINKGAYVFGVLNIVQGLIFLYAGVLKHKLSYEYKPDLYHITGIIFILFALIIYPVIGYLSGHSYPKQPTFGLPCPTTIFTFGILLLSKIKIPKYILIIPLLWSIIGFSAAINLSVKEDIGLLVAGILGTILIIYRDKQHNKE